MTLRDFHRRVVEHPGLQGKYCDEKEVFVEHIQTGVVHALTYDCIHDYDWQELEDVLIRRRDAKVMIWISRIVGYYSRVQNWNRSKLAELADRQAGEYGPPEGV